MMKRIIAVFVALMMLVSAVPFVDVKAASQREKIKNISIGVPRTAVITKDNELYIWGYYSYSGDAWGRYEFPTFIAKGVKQVEIAVSHNAYLKKNGDLYMWGSSADDGLLGFGNEKVSVQHPTHKANVQVAIAMPLMRLGNISAISVHATGASVMA